jgi:hypothetical protein
MLYACIKLTWNKMQSPLLITNTIFIQKMKKVVRKEVSKLIEAGIFDPIADSK